MNPSDATIRVFIALDIAPEARRGLVAAMRELQTAIPNGVRWVDPAGIHLTLKFLGNIDPNLVEPVFQGMRGSAEGTAPFQLRLFDLGLFPNARQPRVLWAGVAGELKPLEGLQQRVDESVSPLGFPRERQPFRPHLTLGRVREGVAPAIRSQIGATLYSIPLGPSEPWLVDAVHLIRSTLTPTGAIYASLGSVPLWPK